MADTSSWEIVLLCDICEVAHPDNRNASAITHNFFTAPSVPKL